MSPAPLCACGCGQPTIMMTRTGTKQGRVKGAYNRYRRGHFHPTRPKGIMGRPVNERFWEKVDKVSHPGGCWEWTGYILWSGYGRFCARKPKVLYAHRFSDQLANGPLPDGLLVLHRCDNRRCVNPAHLFRGTQTDNMQDMIAKGRGSRRRVTHCKHGHEFTPANTRLDARGSRVCRTCARRTTAEYVARNPGRSQALARIHPDIQTAAAVPLTEGH